MQLDLAIKQPIASHQVEVYKTNMGAKIFQLPMEVFPGFWANAYLVNFNNYQVLIDTGSGYGISNQQLIDCLLFVGTQTKRDVLQHLTHIFITHGHIDHFGGLPFIIKRCKASVGVHEFDLKNITDTEKRLTIVARRLKAFLAEAGVEANKQTELIQMYKMTKLDYESVPVDFTYEQVGMEIGPFKFFHVPGHCPGHVVIQLHDVLFSGDHILGEISPHQSPERLARNTGLMHYLNSLVKIGELAEEISITLGGHNSPINNLSKRIDEIKITHKNRLDQILDFLTENKTICDISSELFTNVHGYNELLALEETGAHFEYLLQHGFIGIVKQNEAAIINNNPVRYYKI